MGIGIFYSDVFYLSACHYECGRMLPSVTVVWIIGSVLSKVGNDGSHGTQGVSAKAVLMTWTAPPSHPLSFM